MSASKKGDTTEDDVEMDQVEKGLVDKRVDEGNDGMDDKAKIIKKRSASSGTWNKKKQKIGKGLKTGMKSEETVAATNSNGENQSDVQSVAQEEMELVPELTTDIEGSQVAVYNLLVFELKEVRIRDLVEEDKENVREGENRSEAFEIEEIYAQVPI